MVSVTASARLISLQVGHEKIEILEFRIVLFKIFYQTDRQILKHTKDQSTLWYKQAILKYVSFKNQPFI